MLTPQQIEALARPFTPEEHAFTPDKKPYLTKEAIRARLSMVGQWSISKPEILTQTDSLVVLTAELTLGGETRAAIGTGIVQEVKPDANGEFPANAGYRRAVNSARAFKTAASDLLPRCAIQFNVGGYLKDPAVKSINNPAALANWLKTLLPPPTAASIANGGKLDQASIDQLDGIAQRHTGLELAELLGRVGLGTLDEFCGRYPALDTAQKAIATHIVDKHLPVKLTTAESVEARNGNLYLSVSFGFNNVALFNGAVAATFKDTPYQLTGWNTSGYNITFNPPLIAVLGRDNSNYPRIEKLMIEELA